MRILVIGGSQGTGAQLASLAEAAGHEVTILSRSRIDRAGARTITGDALDPAVATEAVSGADAVVITVGGSKGSNRHRAAVTRSVIDAMANADVRRLLVQSSVGAGDSAVQLPAPMRLITKTLLAKPLADHGEQERTVRESGLDWTIVRPTGLTDKPATGSWRAFTVEEAGTLRGTITRADLAAFMLQVLEDDVNIGRAIGVSN